MMWNPIVVICILISVTNIYCTLEIITKQGKIKGRIWSTQKGRKFVGFTRIPYAKPPVGTLRFQAPIPADPWSDTLDATKPHDPCPQVDYFAKNFTTLGNEDCLYLNVYKPERCKDLPVMFYIHGGSFLIGSGADDWLGPEILLDKDVVLVVINYRLGGLGFLSTEDVEYPGNNGLKDQVQALLWVKENIQYFGGNASSITVFGNSAGAMSAHYFMLSPLTKDLISKVVLQSGPGTTPFSPLPKGEAKSNAEKLGLLSNCSTGSTQALITCLRKVDVTELLRNEFAVAFSKRTSLFPPFQPIIEVNHTGAFMAEDPIQIVKSRNFANIPIIVGIVANEGAYGVAALDSEQFEQWNSNFSSVAAQNFPMSGDVIETSNALRRFYFGNKTIDNFTKPELTDLYSDGWFLSPLDLTLKLLLDYKFANQQVYVYLFGYRGSTSYTTLYGDSYNYGVCHTDELLYLLPQHSLFPNYQPSSEDLKMADALTTWWVQFAITSNPTPVSQTWKPLKDQKLQYLHIKSPTTFRMEEGLFALRREFWRENVYQDGWIDVTRSNIV